MAAAKPGAVHNANVTSLNVGSDGNLLKFVDFITQEGKRGRVRARQFVLASGGIENPRLLLLSNGIEPRGLGNRHDLVGRFFMEHPHIPCALVAANDPVALIGMYDQHRLDGLDVHAALCPSEILQEEQKILNGSVTVEAVEHPDPSVQSAQALWRGLKAREFPDDFDEKVQSVIGGIDTVMATAWKRFAENQRVYGYIQLYARMEQAPNPESRIQLSKERDALGLHRVALDWRLTSVDIRSIDVLTRAVAAEFGRLGYGRVKLADWLFDSSDRWEPRMQGGSHHMGTTRMAEDPKRGVVDANCKIHGIANLYVAGSSVFPTSGYANPTLTIVALALRLSAHLKSLFS